MAPPRERSPFSAFDTASLKDTLPWFRGVVTKVNLDAAKQLAFTYEVLPDLATRATGAANRVMTDVLFLQPVFGSLSDTSQSPTGMLGSPVVGSRVLCLFDGVRWVIIGCYTGPMATPLEQGADYEQRRVGYNSGVELALHRLAGQPGLDLPSYFGFSPGDVLLGKGRARLKVNGTTALIGANEGCVRIYKADGGVLEYCAQQELRAIGRWYRQTFQQGNSATTLANSMAPHLAPPAADATAYQCEVLETAPLAEALAPYLVRRTGHVSRSFASMGRSSIYAAATPYTAAAEKVSKKFAVIHDTLVNPTSAPVAKTQDELAGAAAAKYDLQVDADGSFRLRLGNVGNIPGGQTDAPTGQLDFSFEYSATNHEFLLRVGTAGTEGTVIKIRGQTPLDAMVDVETTNLKATVRQAAMIEAKQLITLKAPSIVLDGAVTVTQTATIMGILTGLQDVLCGGKLITAILASGVPGAPPTPGTPMNVQGGLTVQGPVLTDGPITSQTDVIAAPPTGGLPVTLVTHTHAYYPGPVTPEPPTMPTLPGVG